MSPFALYALLAARDFYPELRWAAADTGHHECTLTCSEGSLTLRWAGLMATKTFTGKCGKHAKKLQKLFDNSFARDESYRLWEANRA